jgi:hypothetical protein
MIKCKEASRLMSRAMDEALPLWQRLALTLHLAICDACRSARRQMRLLRLGVARLVKDRS